MTVPFCVLCRTHPVDPRWRPFCSERCKWLDLAKWMDGEYRIPDVPVKEPGDDETDER